MIAIAYSFILASISNSEFFIFIKSDLKISYRKQNVQDLELLCFRHKLNPYYNPHRLQEKIWFCSPDTKHTIHRHCLYSNQHCTLNNK